MTFHRKNVTIFTLNQPPKEVQHGQEYMEVVKTLFNNYRMTPSAMTEAEVKENLNNVISKGTSEERKDEYGLVFPRITSHAETFDYIERNFIAIKEQSDKLQAAERDMKKDEKREGPSGP